MPSEISVKDFAVKKKLFYWLNLGLTAKANKTPKSQLLNSVQDWKKRLHRSDKRQGKEQVEKYLDEATHIIAEIRNEIRDL